MDTNSDNERNIFEEDLSLAATSKRAKKTEIFSPRESNSKFLSEFNNNECKHCDFTAKLANGQKMKASNAQRHLKRVHRYLYDRITEINERECEITGMRRNFAMFAATTSFPIHLIENTYLQKTLNGNSKSDVPTTRKTLRNDIIKERHMLKVKIKDMIRKSPFIALSTDIATTKGMRYSYMGIVGHLWNGNIVRSVGLEHLELFEQHQSSYIRKLLENVLIEYEIPAQKIVRIVTDSAANMKAAFIKVFEPFFENQTDIFEEFIDPEVATAENMVKLQELYTGNISVTEKQFANKANLDGYNHISCAAHRLQLVLKDVFDKNADALEIRKIVFALLAKFSKSHNVIRELFINCGKKLLFPANTRWSSLQITYSRLLEILTYVNKISKEKNWPEISEDCANKIKIICDLVTPFRGFTDKIQSGSIPTISMLLPGILNLIKHMKKSTTEFPEINNALIDSLKVRFNDVLQSGTTGDPIYLVSSFLDPATFAYLPDDINMECLARAEIKHMCSQHEEWTPAIMSEDDNTEDQFLGFAVERSTQTQRNLIETEISTFFADRKLPSFQSVTAGAYWKHNQKTYPTLRRLAEKLLCVPATSAAVERMFSQMTLHTSGHKANMGPELTTAKVLLSFNKTLIGK